MNKPAREPLLTPQQVAEILRVSVDTARAVMHEEGAIKVRNQLRWTNEKLERYLRAGGSKRFRTRLWQPDPSEADAAAEPADAIAGASKMQATRPARRQSTTGKLKVSQRLLELAQRAADRRKNKQRNER